MMLLGEGEPGVLVELVARFDELSPRASTELAVGDERARSLGVCLLDPAFGVRRRAIFGMERELLEVRSGLAILLATQAGFVTLDDEEAVSIARRVDRSAALLRTMMLDLDLLEASDFAGAAVTTEEVDALIEAAREADIVKRRGLLSALLNPTDAMVKRMADSLVGARLRAALSGELALREASLGMASSHVEELSRLVPDRLPDEEVPAEVRGMSKQERYHLALRHAVEGLREDPFSPELTLYMALSTDWLADRTRSRPWFDRYLALRGIRAHDHRTYQGKGLEADEQIALDAVQLGG